MTTETRRRVGSAGGKACAASPRKHKLTTQDRQKAILRMKETLARKAKGVIVTEGPAEVQVLGGGKKGNGGC